METGGLGLTEQAAKRGYLWRMAFAAVLVALVAAGLLGVFDPRYETAEATGGGFQLSVEHPSQSRLGLPIRWEVEVSTLDGSPLPEQITLATTSAYFELFDENGFDPQPESASNDGELTYTTFQTVPGSSTFSTSFDGRIQPSWQLGVQAVTRLMVDGVRVAEASYETRLWL